MGNTQVEHRTERAAGEGTDVASPRRTGLRSCRARGVGALAALVLAATALVGFANPADAAPESQDAPSVPSCVWTYLDDSGWTDYLEVHNDCGSSKRIKVVLAFATDFPCYTIPAGGYGTFEWGYPGRFDRLEDC